MRSLKTALFLVAVLATPIVGFAQSERGSITGVVIDTSRAAIPGVSVRVINAGTNATTTLVSSETGSYSAASLPPGVYRIEASIPGFQSANVDGIRLTAGATARVDITLNLGQMSESVNVVADAQQMQTQDAKVSTNVSNELIDQLPLVVGGAMRSVFDLVAIVPEAKGTGANVSLGGGQGGAFGATLDGISVNTNRNANTTETAFLTPSVEAITEFSVETNGFKPEFGQAGGGGITFASKSGTNEFHGSLYNFLRNDALDSKGFFEAQKSIYRQNNFGTSWGGPVLLPKYNGRNRTFFFASYEGFVNRQASNAALFSVPTPEMYNGDFSNWVDANGRMIVIYDPATTRPNPNGTGFIREPVPRQQDSGRALQQGGPAVPQHAECQIAGGAQSRRHAGHAGLCEQQLPVGRRHEPGNNLQVQLEDRSGDQQRASRRVSLQSGQQLEPADRRPGGRAARAVQFIDVGRLRRRPAPDELGLDRRHDSQSLQLRREHLL